MLNGEISIKTLSQIDESTGFHWKTNAEILYRDTVQLREQEPSVEEEAHETRPQK